MPSFIGSSPCSFDQFNLMGELPKIDYQNCLHFETHHFVLWISTSSGDRMGWEGGRSHFKANWLGGKLTRCRKLKLWRKFALALDPSPWRRVPSTGNPPGCAGQIQALVPAFTTRIRIRWVRLEQENTAWPDLLLCDSCVALHVLTLQSFHGVSVTAWASPGSSKVQPLSLDRADSFF